MYLRNSLFPNFGPMSYELLAIPESQMVLWAIVALMLFPNPHQIALATCCSTGDCAKDAVWTKWFANHCWCKRRQRSFVSFVLGIRRGCSHEGPSVKLGISTGFAAIRGFVVCRLIWVWQSCYSFSPSPSASLAPSPQSSGSIPTDFRCCVNL